MITYFQKFPTVTTTVNNKPKTLVDISYAYDIEVDTIPTNTVNISQFNDLGNVSKSVYDDATTFWALLMINGEINPWSFVPKNPVSYVETNNSYSAATLKFNGVKNDPTTYVNFVPGDIIVNSKPYYIFGSTAASSLFDFNNLNAWIVSKSFYDTKKAKISQNLNLGYTGFANLADPDISVASANFITLRKGLTGYYPVLGGNTGTNSSNLESYKYVKSPAIITNKTTKYTVSTFEKLTNDDTIFNVITDDSPDPAATTLVDTSYQILPTEEVQRLNYVNQTTKKFTPTNNFSKLLVKLI